MQEVSGPVMSGYQVVGDVVDRQLVVTRQDRAVTNRVGTPGLMVQPEIQDYYKEVTIITRQLINKLDSQIENHPPNTTTSTNPKHKTPNQSGKSLYFGTPQIWIGPTDLAPSANHSRTDFARTSAQSPTDLTRESAQSRGTGLTGPGLTSRWPLIITESGIELMNTRDYFPRGLCFCFF